MRLDGSGDTLPSAAHDDATASSILGCQRWSTAPLGSEMHSSLITLIYAEPGSSASGQSLVHTDLGRLSMLLCTISSKASRCGLECSPVNEPTTRDDCILLICAVQSSDPVITVLPSACTSKAVKAATTESRHYTCRPLLHAQGCQAARKRMGAVDRPSQCSTA